MSRIFFASAAAISAFAILAIGCRSQNGSSASDSGSASQAGTSLKGSISIDGSSTVFPIMEGAVEDFNAESPGVKPVIGVSGTGGGFKKFANGEIDIAGASRPIEASERAAAKKNGIDFTELPIAFDGISVVVNSKATYINDITTDELAKLWNQGSSVKTWADLKAGYPAQPVKLYGPSTDNGTFDYFTEVIGKKKGNSRTDYQASATPNVLVQGIAGDQYALGYFGYAYYVANKDKLKLLSVNGVQPSEQTILDGSYAPLSRPLFIYVSTKSLQKPEVKAFVSFVLNKGQDAIKRVGYVVLPDEVYAADKAILDGAKTGSRFMDNATGLKIQDVVNREAK